MFRKKRVIRGIENKIDDLTMDCIAPRMEVIERDIKYLYWQGFLSKKRYERMMDRINEKYNEVHEEWVKRLEETWERDFQRLIKT